MDEFINFPKESENNKNSNVTSDNVSMPDGMKS